jgi:hypothetical protein
MRHFKHCYAYEGAYCGCGAEQFGGFAGEDAGPDTELPAAPFALKYEAPSQPVPTEPGDA